MEKVKRTPAVLKDLVRYFHLEILNRGVDFETAWRMASVNPARIAGIDLPLLRKGDEASFVVYGANGIEKSVFMGVEYLA